MEKIEIFLNPEDLTKLKELCMIAKNIPPEQYIINMINEIHSHFFPLNKKQIKRDDHETTKEFSRK